MDGTVAVTTTVISGLVALLSAIIAVIKSSKVSRIQAEASLAQERLRTDQERESRAWHDAKIEADRLASALDEMWQHLQAIRETIAKLTSGQRYDIDIALRDAEHESALVMDAYSKFGSQLPHNARIAWHDAKNVCTSILLELQALHTRNDGPSKASLNALRSMRDTLADIQQLIARERQHFFETAFREYVRIPYGFSQNSNRG